MAAERVFVGLGANLGDPGVTVASALQPLDRIEGTRLVRYSRLYRSAPIDADGPDFINAVAELATRLEPLPLLAALHAIEARFGRERPRPNAPRTLDLDLLLFGQRVIEQPALAVPHPRLHERAFVLLPLLEVAPDVVHPTLGPLAACLPGVLDQDIEVLR